MTREDAVRQACEIMALAYHSIGEYAMPADGFCDKCPAATVHAWGYSNSGEVFDYVRKAVLNQLAADGHRVSSAFDSTTGRPHETVADEEAAQC